MKRWWWAMAPMGGTGMALVLFFRVDQALGAVVMLAIVVAIFGGHWTSIGGAVGLNDRLDPAELRAYRLQHPGSTITDAIGASENSRGDGRSSD